MNNKWRVENNEGRMNQDKIQELNKSLVLNLIERKGCVPEHFFLKLSGFK